MKNDDPRQRVINVRGCLIAMYRFVSFKFDQDNFFSFPYAFHEEISTFDIFSRTLKLLATFHFRSTPNTVLFKMYNKNKLAAPLSLKLVFLFRNKLSLMFILGDISSENVVLVNVGITESFQLNSQNKYRENTAAVHVRKEILFNVAVMHD